MSHPIVTWLRAPLRLLSVGVFVALAGCVQQYPISYYASPGDTIVLGLGGIQRNSNNSDTLNGTDLTITLTNDSTQQSMTLTANNGGFKAFPDYVSNMNLNAINGSLIDGNVVPFDGGWFVPVTLPSSASLTPGAYTISVTSPTHKLVNTKWCPYTGFCEGDLENIPLQIIDSGSNAGAYSQQFSYYYPARHLDVSPNATPDSAGYTSVGGMQLAITFPAANYDATLPIMAVPRNHNPSISLLQNIVDNGDGTKTLVVLLTAPQGFAAEANRTPLTPLLDDLSLSFLFFPISGVTYSSAQQLGDFVIDLDRSHYYDMSGNAIAALHPVMTYQ